MARAAREAGFEVRFATNVKTVLAICTSFGIVLNAARG